MKRVISLLLFFLIPVSIYCQLIPVTDQYLFNPMSINPAMAGGRSALCASVFYRNQWVGMEGAPNTGTLSVDAPFLGDRIGLGMMLLTDNIGVTKEKQIISNYAYKIHMGDGVFSMGLGAGVIITNTAFSDLEVNDEGDDYFLIDSRTFVIPNFRFGLFYSFKSFYAGFSIPQFLTYSFDFEKEKYTLNNDISKYNYMLTTGYSFALNREFSIKPSTLLSYLPSEGLTCDINAQVGYRDRLWMGLSYRTSNTVAALLNLQVNNQIAFGYTYFYDISDIGKYNNGSHQIMLRYEFSYKVDVVNPLIF